jgi:hypothetical protein
MDELKERQKCPINEQQSMDERKEGQKCPINEQQPLMQYN